MDFIKQPQPRVTSSPSSKMENSEASLEIQSPSRDSRSHARASKGRASSLPRISRCCVCSFCGRVCRNGQALGGHMNLHRSEKALAKQLVQLRNQQDNCRNGGAKGMNHGLLGGCVGGESEQYVITHACDMQEGSSSSSSSPPRSRSLAKVSRPVLPRKPVLLPPRECQPLCGGDSVDLELRLGLGPG